MQNNSKQVRDLAIEQPSSVRVFERFGIDYCCGGRKPLEQVCAEQNISLADVLRELATARGIAPEPADGWATRPIAELTEHIVSDCHATTRVELARLFALSQKVRNRHGERHPELIEIEELVHRIADEMMPHMEKEEQVLFPYLVSLELAHRNHHPRPASCVGSIAALIEAMMAEHELVGSSLARIRICTRDFQPPDGACPTYHALYAALADFERLTHRHVHLENNILFPRSMALAGGDESCHTIERMVVA